jgi:hypothetical protein
VAIRGIENVHERALDAPPAAVGELMESLSSREDRLWPTLRWPAMRMDRRLEPGSDGGHGPVRYVVARHDPGRLVAFAFTPAFPIDGEHRYELLPAPDGRGAVLRHTLEGNPRRWLRLGWPLCFRWLHDALIEDSLDRAEAELAGLEWRPGPLPPHVRLLRWIAGRLAVAA